MVSRLNKEHRKADSRKSKRLGKDEHIVQWYKQTTIRSVDRKTYHAFPQYVTVREIRVCVEQLGFRTKTTILVTTILDPTEASKDDPASLFRRRWRTETDLRSIESTVNIGCLALQDTRTRTQRNRHSYPGLQPSPHDHGPGCLRIGNQAMNDWLQRNTSDPGGLQAADSLPGAPRQAVPQRGMSASRSFFTICSAECRFFFLVIQSPPSTTPWLLVFHNSWISFLGSIPDVRRRRCSAKFDPHSWGTSLCPPQLDE